MFLNFKAGNLGVWSCSRECQGGMDGRTGLTESQEQSKAAGQVEAVSRNQSKIQLQFRFLSSPRLAVPPGVLIFCRYCILGLSCLQTIKN